MPKRAVSYVVAFLATCGVACAVGTTADGTGAVVGSGDEAGVDSDSGSGGVDAGSGGFDAGNANDDAGGGDAGTDASTADGGTSDGGGGDAGDGGGGGISCAVTNTCAGGRAIGTVSGDTGSATASGTGATSEWLTVRVTEDDSGIFGVKLRAKVTLTSPPGTNFDLYVYVNSGSDTRECTSVSAQSTQPAGTADTASLSWGEGSVSNGSDDGRTVSIEVRNVSGTCDPSATWSVQVQGNQ
jgi:hypothetical protein